MQWEDDAAASRLELADGRILTKCDQCRVMHAERNPPTVPPCITCRIPLRPENEDAGRIFQIVRGQVLTRFNGQFDVVVDLNHVAVWAAIDAYEMKDRTHIFEKVLRLFHQIEAERRE